MDIAALKKATSMKILSLIFSLYLSSMSTIYENPQKKNFFLDNRGDERVLEAVGGTGRGGG